MINQVSINSLKWVVRALVAPCLILSLGCTKVSFEGQSDAGSDTTQGGPPPPPPPSGGEVVTSYFFVKRAADILFVIDTSGSMSEEQALLRNGFPSFTSTLNTYSGNTLEWHVAITTTDLSGSGAQGALSAFSGMPSGTYFLDSTMNVSAANASFQSTVVLGTGGSGDERGIAAARMTAEREFNASTTRGFIRPDTPLSVIVLSDEDERSIQDPSHGEYRPLEPIDEPNNFVSGIRALDTLSAIPKTITFHSIVTSTQACLNGPGTYMGQTYMALSNMTNGIIGDICALNASYQEQLQSLAMNIVNEAKTYTLPCNDVGAGTTAIFEQELGGALVFVPSTFVPPNKVVLQTAPAVGSLIKARFTCLD